MACDLALLISTYNADEGKIEQKPVSLNLQVSEDEAITMDRVVEAFAALSPSQRAAIASQLSGAKAQAVTATLFRKPIDLNGGQRSVRIVGNITMKELLDTFPTLAQRYTINQDLYSNYTILLGSSLRVNDVNYNGRVISATGQEFFVIKDFYGAMNFIKYLQTKEAIDRIFSEDNSEIPDSVKPFMEDLELIAKKKRMSIPKVLETYLNDKSELKLMQVDGRTIVPRDIIGRAIHAITGEYNNDMAMTDMELALSDIKEKGTGYNWKIEKGSLYEVLKAMNPEAIGVMTEEDFKSLSTEDLNSLFFGPDGIFLGHPKLDRAKVLEVTFGDKTVLEAEGTTKITTKRLSKEIIKQAWEEVRRQADAAGISLPAKYSEFAKMDPDAMSQLFNSAKFQYTPEGSTKIREITTRVVVNNDGSKSVQYNYEVETEVAPKVKETKSYVTLTFPYSFMGDVYGFGYNTQHMFSAITQGPVVNGKYKGFYVYKATIKGKDVYAVGRNLISPHSYMTTTPTLEAAIEAIEKSISKDKIKDNSLLSIKQQQAMPRECHIELNHLQEGQIISVRDIALPAVKFNKLPSSLKQLFNLTVPEVHQILAGIEDITKLETPEDMAAFLYLAYNSVSAEDARQAELNTKNVWSAFLEPGYEEIMKDIINKDILSAPYKHFHLEKLIVSKDNKTGKTGTLRYLNDAGTDINLEGTRVGSKTTGDFIAQSMNDAIEFIQNQYGLPIHAMTSTELEQYDADHNLGIKDKISSIRAFIHDGEIFINTSNAKMSDLFHEVSHMLLGVLKTQYTDGYYKLIDFYTNNPQHKGAFGRKFDYMSRIYKGFAKQDIIEEAVVDMIADNIMRNGKLVTGFDTSVMQAIIDNITNTVDSFARDMKDNGLGFDSYMKQLMASHKATLKKQRIASNFIQQALENKQIIEDC